MGGEVFVHVDKLVKAEMTEGGVLLSNILDVISEALQVVTVAIGLGFILIKPFSQVFWHSPSWCQGVRTK